MSLVERQHPLQAVLGDDALERDVALKHNSRQLAVRVDAEEVRLSINRNSYIAGGHLLRIEKYISLGLSEFLHGKLERHIQEIVVCARHARALHSNNERL